MSPAAPPSVQLRTPSPQPIDILSSPVKLPQPFAEHKREEVEAFSLIKDSHQRGNFESWKDFLSFLEVSPTVLRFKSPKSIKFSFQNFVWAANIVAKSIQKKHFSNSPLLVFKSTGNKTHRGHVTDTECKPDITAAFQGDWADDNTILWPCIKLAGEEASKGKTKEQQRKQGMSYLHYLLLARPDLHVAQGLHTSLNGIMFLVGIGGYGVHQFSVGWNHENIYKLVYAFVYRLYDPGNFGDSPYLSTASDLQKNSVTYTIRINVDVGKRKKVPMDCSGFSPIFASKPFESRTHILSNRHSKVQVGGKALRVIKDQLCRIQTRFDEHSILTQVHSPDSVPGVVEAVYHESIKIPASLNMSRAKQRMGLRQFGSPITRAPTLKAMLEIVFDALEVLRYLRIHRQVLHHDISKGNVLYLEEGARLVPDAETSRVNTTETEGKEVPLCFIKYLLKESTHPRKTSILLIDFNHAEHLGSKEDSQFERITRTGTAVFIARAVEQGKAVILPPQTVVVPAVPISPDIYTRNHPDRIKKFPFEDEKLFKTHSAHNLNRQWRHELDHDAESVFWLIIYWVMAAQPTEVPTTDIGSGAWGMLHGSIGDRVNLVNGLSIATELGGIAHPLYKPLLPLLRDLSRILTVDRYWLDENETRNEPEYVPEAFQRLVLQFILDNHDEKFMTTKVKIQARQVGVVTKTPSLTATSAQLQEAEGNRKRPSPEPSTQLLKRRRVVKDVTEDAGEDETMGGEKGYSKYDHLNEGEDEESNVDQGQRYEDKEEVEYETGDENLYNSDIELG